MVSASQVNEHGSVLRRAREAAGWSQRELARRAGVHQPQVARAERGEDLLMSVLARLAAPLGLSPGLLVTAGVRAASASPGSAATSPPDSVEASIDSWRATWPDVDPEVFAVFARLLRAGRHVNAALEHIAQLHGLTSGDVVVLGALRRSGAPYESTPTALKRLLWISLPGLKKRLDRLESLGFITRGGNPLDGRGVVVRATARGVTLVDEMVARSPERVWNTLRHMPPADLAQLSARLRSLLAPLDAAEEPAGKH
jgi:DNA-binding MarR family transcriptional regulator/DNA-binding XRE family transcriptional regulator